MTLTDEKWTLAVDININDYLDLTYRVKQQMKFLDIIGKGLTDVVTGYQMRFLEEESKTMNRRLDQVTEILNGITETSTPAERRHKRGLANIGGTALKFLFGTADDNDLSRIHQKFDDISVQHQEMVHSIQASASLLNRTYGMLKRNSATLEEVVKATRNIQNEINSIHEQIRRNHDSTLRIVDAHFTINANLRLLGFVISSIEHNVTQLMLALDKISQGRLSTSIINPAKLRDTLSSIIELLPNDYTFLHPVRLSDIYNFYLTSRTYALAYDKTIRILVDLPLTTLGRTFALYKVTPFHHFNSESNTTVSIKPKFPFFAITDDAQAYYEMDYMEVAGCTGSTWKICKPFKAVRRLPVISCNMALFRGDAVNRKKLCKIQVSTSASPEFARTEGDNRWAYSVPKPAKAVINCLSSNKTTRHFEMNALKYLEDTGLLSLEKTCSAQIDGYTLLPHSEDTTEVTMAQSRFTVPNVLATTKRNETTSDPEQHEIVELLSQIYDQDFQATDLELSQLRLMVTKLEEVPKHEIKENWLPYSIMTTAFVIIIILSTTIWIQRRLANGQPIRNHRSTDTFDTYTPAYLNMQPMFNAPPPPPLPILQVITEESTQVHCYEEPRSLRV